MLFRIENIPHRNRKLFGKCRGCNRHSTFKIKLHKTKPAFRLKPGLDGEPIIHKEYKPIGKKPYLLCSKGCVTMAQLKFL
jgi:hypothetical protein